MESSPPSRRPLAGCGGYWARRRRSEFSFSLSLRSSKLHVEPRADTRLRPHAELPVVGVDDLAHIAKPKPGAARFGREKWREELLQFGFLDSFSGVFHTESVGA